MRRPYDAIEVVLLAGGRGTRLAPYTTVLPKPLMPIGEMPVLEILLRRLAKAGFQRTHLAVGYLAELIEAYFGDGSRWGIELVYWREEEPLGTAGPLATIETAAEHLLVMNGDLFTALDFGAFVDYHLERGATATIATRRREVPVEFGVIHLDGDMIVDYDEKPTLSYDVSMGIYAFEREVVDVVPQGPALRLSRARARAPRPRPAGRVLPVNGLLARHRPAGRLRASPGALRGAPPCAAPRHLSKEEPPACSLQSNQLVIFREWSALSS